MSNPYDDPGHRPPPPRQGEPPPYHDGPPPPHQDGPPPLHQDGQPHYQDGRPPYRDGPPSPPQQPPPDSYRLGPAAYGPPSQPPRGGPGHPSGAGKGVLGALFDLSFDHMVTTRLIKAAYVLAIAVYSLVALLMLLFAWSFFVWSKPLGFITLLATPVIWIAGLLTTRMVLEFVINQYKITEHLKAMRERDGLR